MPTKHYTYGSSTAARTMGCNQWVHLSRNMPPQAESDAAREGTAMHTVFERGNLDPELVVDDYLGEVVEGVEITEEHLNKIGIALELQDQATARLNIQVEPEVTLITTKITGKDNVGGTLDIIGVNHEENIFYIGDLKTGDGHMVYAENNDQLLFGAYLAVIEDYDDFKFDENTVFYLAIIQPSDRREDPYDVWQTDLRTVLNWGKQYEKAVQLAEKGIGSNCIGGWCKFCPATLVCPEKLRVVEQSRRIRKDTTELESLNSAMAIIDEVEDWCRSIRKIAHEQAELGVKLNGWKLVAKRATRKWDDEAAAEKIARSMKIRVGDMMSQKLLTPAQLEKVCKKLGKDFDRLNEHVIMHSSGTTLAHADDPRPEAKDPKAALGELAKRLDAKS